MLSQVWWLNPASGQIEAIPPLEVDLPRYRSGVRWLIFAGTDRDDTVWMRETFGFHPLPLEDCLNAGQRPKVETYDGHSFIDVYVAEFDRPGDALVFHEIDCFVGQGFLVTSHSHALPVLDEVLQRWSHDPHRTVGGAGHLLFLLLDTLVDGYFPVVDLLEERLEKLEEILFERFDEKVVTSIFKLKKDLVHFRRIVAPTRDVCERHHEKTHQHLDRSDDSCPGGGVLRDEL